MARDSLRATLDDLALDEASAKDRPYLEAMLRRLGYTETEIRAELDARAAAPSTAVPAPDAIEQDFGRGGPPPGDELAPSREFRLVIPARESAFSYADPNAGRADAPFEAFERVEFEEAPADAVEFQEVAPEAPLEEEPVEFIEEPAPIVEEPAPIEALEPLEALEPPAEEPAPFEETPVEDLQADAPDERPLDTFGGPAIDTAPKTRVRVKRVRARSKQEAESKVASGNRKVIKSIPVDIVERWGPGEKGGKS